MHGRPRIPLRDEAAAPTPQQEFVRKKVEKLRGLQQDVVRFRQENVFTDEALMQSAAVLQVNADVPVAWNLRKRVLCHLQGGLSMQQENGCEGCNKEGQEEGAEDASPGGFQMGEKLSSEILKAELRVVEDALRCNPKAYGPWHHRKWLLLPLLRRDPDLPAPGVGQHAVHIRGWEGVSAADCLARELGLLRKFLQADDRNFHGWDYRRYVAALSGAPPSQELAFTEEKINENFSNYSAWHYRSKLLPASHPDLADEPKTLAAEFDLVRQAAFTEPEDQSGWMYTLWLLAQAAPRPPPTLVATWPPPPHSPQPPPADRPAVPELLLAFSEPVSGLDARTAVVELEPPGSAAGVPGVARGNPQPLRVSWAPVGGISGFALVWRARPLEIDVGYAAGAPSSTEGVKASPRPCTVLRLGASSGIVAASGLPYGEPVELRLPDLFLADGVPVVNGREGGQAAEKGCGANGVQCAEGADGLDAAVAAAAADVAPSCRGEWGAGALRGLDPTWRLETVEREVASCRELLELEPDCKWGLFTLARLLETGRQLAGSSLGKEGGKGEDDGARGCAAGGDWGEVAELYERLVRVDPFRAEFYRDRVAALRLRHALSKQEEQTYCGAPQVLDKGGLESTTEAAAVVLSGLGLSSLQPSQLLLSCTALDLSHNCFRSAAGFEILQRLERLDLSHNSVKHSAALRPLGLLGRLAALNLAHNRLGETAYDTTRYLFPSPLSNSRPWPQPHGLSDVDGGTGLGAAYPQPWGCLWYLGCLKGLTVLDLRGNPVESFRGFREVVEGLLPNLVELSGHALAPRA